MFHTKRFKVVSISLTDEHAAAVKADGSLWTWGRNERGQLGNSGASNDIYVSSSGINYPCQTAPIKIMDGVDSVYCSESITFIRKRDNSLWVAGSNWTGALGIGTNDESAQKDVPVKVMDDVAVVSVSYHARHTVAAIKTDGTLWTWGDEYLGNGTLETSYKPVKIMDNVKSVSCGINGMMAIKNDGTLWTWGSNIYGQVGNAGAGNNDFYGAYKCQTVPTQIMEGVSYAYCGNTCCAAIKNDGTLWMWGLCNYGLIADGNLEGNDIGVDKSVHIQTVPVKILDNVTSVFVGKRGTTEGPVLAIKDDKTCWMWGESKNYINSNYVPAPIKVLDDVSAACCYSSFAAIRTDGTLWTWGNNDHETLGYSGGNYRRKAYAIMSFGGTAGSSQRDWYTVVQVQPRQISNLVMNLPSASTAISTSQPSAIAVTVNGQTVKWTDAVPFIDANNRTMVPLRAVGDALGLTVEWDGEKREASFSDGNKTIYFPIDSNTAHTSDGRQITMDTAAIVIDGRTYAPIRYLAEFFGYTVDWDGESRTVRIK